MAWMTRWGVSWFHVSLRLDHSMDHSRVGKKGSIGLLESSGLKPQVTYRLCAEAASDGGCGRSQKTMMGLDYILIINILHSFTFTIYRCVDYNPSWNFYIWIPMKSTWNPMDYPSISPFSHQFPGELQHFAPATAGTSGKQGDVRHLRFFGGRNQPSGWWSKKRVETPIEWW